MIWIGILVIIATAVGLVTAVEKIKFGEQEEISWFFITLGMYNWSQVIVLAPLWLFFGIGSLFFWQPAAAIKAYALFHVARSVAEMIQAAVSEDVPLAKLVLPKNISASAVARKSGYISLQSGILFICLLFLFGIFP